MKSFLLDITMRLYRSTITTERRLPGCNVITRDHLTAKDSFRESVFDLFHDVIVDEGDSNRLLATYEALLKLRPPKGTIKCPYSHLGCEEDVTIASSVGTCQCSRKKTFWPTDALRIHERFNDDSGSNGEAFGYVLSVWERLILVHLLRCFEERKWLARLGSIAFFVDGPLAVFGPPAWISASIKQELQRINTLVKQETGNDLMIVGVEKTGNFVAHFEEIDKREDGSSRFQPRTYLLPTDSYIKRKIILSDSTKRYGADTYFGRKLFYKTASGARIVASIPFLSDDQDSLDSDVPTAFPRFGTICNLLDKLVTSRFPNALAPIVSAHAHASIPLHLGQKVLTQLARVLMQS